VEEVPHDKGSEADIDEPWVVLANGPLDEDGQWPLLRECMAIGDVSCRQSGQCRRVGRCDFGAFDHKDPSRRRCFVENVDSCEQAEVCHKEGKCKLGHSGCEHGNPD
jgi:hypothetical protein